MINNKAAELARVRLQCPLWSVSHAEPDGYAAQRAGYADIYDDTLAGLSGQISKADKRPGRPVSAGQEAEQ